MTINFKNVYVNNVSTVAGPFVIEGPLKGNFDIEYSDFYDGEDTYEKCEIKELKKCINKVLEKSELYSSDIDCIFQADLMNQIAISNCASTHFSISQIGIYSACASSIEGIILASSFLDSNKMNKVICTTSSHNMTAERQYRNPTEYGAPKKKTCTFTVSGATAILLQNEKSKIKIDSGTIGKVIDKGMTDVNDMGSVMAPAAAFTLNEHLKDTKRNIDYYDLILTGDLGKYGKEIFKEYCKKEYDIDISNNYDDSATMIYDYKRENVYAGGSGPSCLPLVVYSSIIPKMLEGKIKNVLLLATGALMSTTIVNQKMSIPSICHAVSLEVVE